MFGEYIYCPDAAERETSKTGESWPRSDRSIKIHLKALNNKALSNSARVVKNSLLVESGARARLA